MNPLRIALLCLVALPVAACGDDVEPFTLNGVYTITAWTQNTMSCDTEGPSILDVQDDSSFIVSRQSDNLFGQSFTIILAGPCADAQACSDTAAGGVFGAAFSNLSGFENQKMGDGWESSSSYASRNDVECTGAVTSVRLTSPAEGQVRLEKRTTDDIGYPATPDDDGMLTCDLDELERLANTAGCLQYEAITAENPTEIPPASMMQ